jgi:HSP20 family protein
MNMRDLIPWGRQSSSAPAVYNQTGYRDEQVNPLVGFRREVDRLFDDLFRWPDAGFGLGMRRSALAWPNIEVSDDDREVRITAEVPGLSEEDVELLVQDGVLTLRGEKKSETEDKERGYSERFYGRFERRIALPGGIAEESAKADFRDGVLTVTLPKTAEAQRGRRIPINGGTRH